MHAYSRVSHPRSDSLALTPTEKAWMVHAWTVLFCNKYFGSKRAPAPAAAPPPKALTTPGGRRPVTRSRAGEDVGNGMQVSVEQ
jgi:hypothetical protein